MFVLWVNCVAWNTWNDVCSRGSSHFLDWGHWCSEYCQTQHGEPRGNWVLVDLWNVFVFFVFLRVFFGFLSAFCFLSVFWCFLSVKDSPAVSKNYSVFQAHLFSSKYIGCAWNVGLSPSDHLYRRTKGKHLKRHHMPQCSSKEAAFGRCPCHRLRRRPRFILIWLMFLCNGRCVCTSIVGW